MATELEAAYALLDGLLKNPETRREQLQLMKKHNPNIVVPEIDAAAPYDAKIEELRASHDALKKELEERRADDKLTASFERLRTKRGLTDEGVQKVREIMASRSIPDPEDAATLFEAAQPKNEPAPPSSYTPGSWIDEGDKDLEPWFQNEDRAADMEVANYFRERSSQSMN